MKLSLGIMATTIWLLYSFYFWKIIKGNPQVFELELLHSLADWIISKGVKSRTMLWIVLGLSIWVEIIYFYLTLRTVTNPFLINLTFVVILFEVYHIVLISYNLQRFFSGRYPLGQIFNWRIERTSAGLFFTHTLLVLFVLIAMSK